MVDGEFCDDRAVIVNVANVEVLPIPNIQLGLATLELDIGNIGNNYNRPNPKSRASCPFPRWVI